MPSAAETALREAYGFDHVAVGERLEGGYANDLYRATADGRELVLRLQSPPIDLDDVAWEHRLVDQLARALDEVHGPLPTVNRATWFELEDRIAWLMPFVDGQPADATCEGHRRAAARALGRLHRAGAELELPPRPACVPLAEREWPPLVVPPELEPWADTIAQGREWAIAHVARLAADRRLPSSLVHGDFFPGNVLVAGDELTAVLDWEEAHTDWLAWDLASAAGSFCSNGDELDHDAFAGFVAAYREAGGPSPASDDDLLVGLLRVARILEVLRAPTDRDPRWDLQEQNLRSLPKLA